MKLAELSIKDVVPSDANTRVDYNGTDMAELVKSIEAVGLLNPILVRKCGDAGYEIIAGHRRYHALKKLGKETVPAQIMDATEEDAAQIRLIENLHRKDLNPIEEARAFQQLRDQYNLDTKAIAERADKSVPYVARALALLGLPKAAVKAIEAGALPASHGHQIARAPEKQREMLAAFATKVNEWTKRVPTLDELKREIEKKVEKSLTLAPFPKDVAHYGGTELPECNACPFNTGNQGVLFDGAVAGKCTNPGCYKKRDTAFYKDLAEKTELKLGVKFLGAKVPMYNSDREFMGYRIVKADAKTLKAKPDDFAFGIWKPEPHGYGRKKPEVVVVSLKKDAAKESGRPVQDDYDKRMFVERFVTEALMKHVDAEITEIGKPALIAMMDEGDITRLKKMTREQLIKELWMGWAAQYQTEDRILASDVIDSKALAKLAKQAVADAEAAYAAHKEKAS